MKIAEGRGDSSKVLQLITSEARTVTLDPSSFPDSPCFSFEVTLWEPFEAPSFVSEREMALCRVQFHLALNFKASTNRFQSV